MFKRAIGLLILAFAFLALPGRAGAATTAACPTTITLPAYVSSGSQILCVETASSGFGTTAVVVTDNTSTFCDLAFGPDGKVYGNDCHANRVFRVDPRPTFGSPVLELVATLPSGAIPGGLGFGGSDGDLYVITNIGVFRFQRIASLFSTPDPIVVIPSGGFTPTTPDIPLSATAGGAAFGPTGTLLIVNQAGKGTVLSSDPVIGSVNPYPSITNPALITDFSNKTTTTSRGIAVNTCGDILVASANVIKRFSISGSLLNASFATLGTSSKDIVQYTEVDAHNNLIAVTNSTSAGGKVWFVPPVVPSGGDPITSCASGAVTRVFSLADVPKAVGLLSTDASGLALPPTSHSSTHAFGGGATDTCTSFDSADTTKTYNYGHHSWTVTYTNGIFTCFPQTFMAVRVRPVDLGFNPLVFKDDTRCALYPSLGGFCVQYLDTSESGVSPSFSPPPTTDYASGIRIKVGFFTPLGFFFNPGLADCPDTSPNTLGNACDTDISHDFYPAAGPGTDPSSTGIKPLWGSRFAVFNEPLAFLDCVLTLKEPALSNNPQFKFGQTIRVAFNLTHKSDGSTCPNAFERLSILRTDPPPLHAEKVVATNNSNVDNIFNFGNNLYTFPVDSSFFETFPQCALCTKGTKAKYQFTIFGNGASPFSFFITVVH